MKIRLNHEVHIQREHAIQHGELTRQTRLSNGPDHLTAAYNQKPLNEGCRPGIARQIKLKGQFNAKVHFANGLGRLGKLFVKLAIEQLGPVFLLLAARM